MKTIRLALCGLLVAQVFGGCMSARNHPALEAIQNAVNSVVGGGTKADEVILEAYFEYPGPAEKWAGPVSFVLHVSAKDPHHALIHAAPLWFNEELKGDYEPEPGASPVPNPAHVETRGVSTDYARERLRDLAVAVQGEEIGFKGCLSPIRIRLIRENGTFIEKTGCRSESGWPKMVGELVDYFLSGKFHGLKQGAQEAR